MSLIGLGNWGSSLAYGLLKAKIPLDEVIVAGRGSVRNGPRRAGALPLTSLDCARLEADVLWLCVPDGEIAQVNSRLVTRVADRGFTGQWVVHSSGVLSAQVLKKAAHAGALVGSVHPLMSFPTRNPVPLKGVWFAVEAEAGARMLNRIVREIGGRPFAIKAASKALYHAVGVLCSPLLVSHLAAAQEAAALAGFSARQARELMEPIARATLDNFFLKSAGKSFSGPLARGDAETIRLHLQALEPHPMVADVYRSLALYALETLPSADRRALRASLRRKG